MGFGVGGGVSLCQSVLSSVGVPGCGRVSLTRQFIIDVHYKRGRLPIK